MDFGWWGDRDAAAAVSFLARQPGVSVGKIATLGESMGGEQGIAAMGADPRIRAVVAEGATGQQLADHGWKPASPGSWNAAWNGAVHRGRAAQRRPPAGGSRPSHPPPCACGLCRTAGTPRAWAPHPGPGKPT